MSKTHWKKIVDNDYLNEGDLDAGNIIATIESIDVQEITNPTGKTEVKHVIKFKEKNVKPMVLSAKQNFKNIASATGTPYIEEWSGKKIEIYYDPNVRFGSQKVGGVRVSPNTPKKPKLTKQMPAYAKVVLSLKDKKTTWEIVKEHYEITPELETEINYELNTENNA